MVVGKGETQPLATGKRTVYACQYYLEETAYIWTVTKRGKKWVIRQKSRFARDSDHSRPKGGGEGEGGEEGTAVLPDLP